MLGALREGGYRFVAQTPATHARVDSRSENEVARDLADVFGWSRFFADDVVPEPESASRAADMPDIVWSYEESIPTCSARNSTAPPTRRPTGSPPWC